MLCADHQVFRERRDQEQRERDRLDKERREREEREREGEREKARLKEERDRQAMEDVNRHFELSIEFAKKVGLLQLLHSNNHSTTRSQVSTKLKYLDSLLSQFQS